MKTLESFSSHQLKKVMAAWKVGDIVKKFTGTHAKQKPGEGGALPIVVLAKLMRIGPPYSESYGHFSGIIIEPESEKGKPYSFKLNLGGHMDRRKFIEATEQEKKFLNSYLSAKQFDL